MAASVTLTGFSQRSNGQYSSASQFPLRAEYYMSAQMPLNIIYPRPNGETQTHARHRWAHTQMLYEIPIGVQGGAWPFKYEVIYDTSGAASIGQYWGDANYGVLRLNNALLVHGQTYDYTVRVTGCDGVYIDISRSVTVDDTKFIFVQSGYGGTKVGTISQPLATFADWYGASQSNATYLNKIIVWRGGAYSSVTIPAENSGNMRLVSTTKTPSLIGFPGEEPIVDMTLSKFLDDTTGINDLFISGITWDNARNDINNPHYFWITDVSHRATFWKNKFINMQHGLVGDDNTGPIFVGATAVVKNYMYIADNYCENIVNGVGHGSGNGTLYTVYRTSNLLIERNTAQNCDTGIAIFAKGTVAFVTIRANSGTVGMTGGMLGLGYGAEAGEIPHDHEVVWNNFKTVGQVIVFANSDTYIGQSYNTYVSRNTLQGTNGRCQYVGAENFYTDANILNFDTYTTWDETIQTSTVPNIKTTAVDAAGELTSALGFGTHGWRPY